jgi:PIN domain nuclease of toxin-antitoxin system
LILLDAFPVIAYLNDEPAADEVEGLLRGGSCTINSVNLAEALDNLFRVQRLSV